MKSAFITTTLFFSLSLGIISEKGHDHNSDKFTTEFTELIETYLVLKDALVESDSDVALSAASQMLEQLKDISEHRLEGEDNMKWMDSYSKIESNLTEITGSTDLDEIRTHFYGLSETLIAGVKSFDIEGVIYHQHCPMAFNNEGGSWLSSEDQVMNPYLPDTMLRCGRVIEKIES
jgi:membrane fusion protein, copper/silver efflux system